MKDNWASYNDAGFVWMDCIDYSFLSDPVPETQKYAPQVFSLYTLRLYAYKWHTLIKIFCNINFIVYN